MSNILSEYFIEDKTIGWIGNIKRIRRFYIRRIICPECKHKIDFQDKQPEIIEFKIEEDDNDG